MTLFWTWQEALAVAVMDGATRMPRRMAEMGGAVTPKPPNRPACLVLKVGACLGSWTLECAPLKPSWLTLLHWCCAAPEESIKQAQVRNIPCTAQGASRLRWRAILTGFRCLDSDWLSLSQRRFPATLGR